MVTSKATPDTTGGALPPLTWIPVVTLVAVLFVISRLVFLRCLSVLMPRAVLLTVLPSMVRLDVSRSDIENWMARTVSAISP